MTNTFNDSQIVTNIPEMSVSALSASIKNLVEDAFGYVRVKGELSKVVIAKSGHLYTSLKDEAAVLDGVCWKGTVQRLKIKPEEGLEVICTGRITTYPGRSNYQMVIESMELAGIGAILKMLEALKVKLAGEGLFAKERKKPLPFLPRRIGVVTSPTGAVIRDILHRLGERFPLEVSVWPVNVQGERAAAEIIAGIKGFNAMQGAARPDVIIVARGGGSFEDLMPFNDEALVRAAAASDIPLISAVGHETDVTLIDYAADLRAPTPTAAAEMAVPVREMLVSQILDNEQRLRQALRGQVTQAGLRLDRFVRVFERPEFLLEAPMQRLDRAGMMLEHGLGVKMQKYENALLVRGAALRTPREVLVQKSLVLEGFAERMVRTAEGVCRKPEEALNGLGRVLESLSFKSVLARGYAVVRGEDGKLVSSANLLSEGQKIGVEFVDGTRSVRVE